MSFLLRKLTASCGPGVLSSAVHGTPKGPPSLLLSIHVAWRSPFSWEAGLPGFGAPQAAAYPFPGGNLKRI